MPPKVFSIFLACCILHNVAVAQGLSLPSLPGQAPQGTSPSTPFHWPPLPRGAVPAPAAHRQLLLPPRAEGQEPPDMGVITLAPVQ